jgi:hypothetical protein
MLCSILPASACSRSVTVGQAREKGELRRRRQVERALQSQQRVAACIPLDLGEQPSDIAFSQLDCAPIQ